MRFFVRTITSHGVNVTNCPGGPAPRTYFGECVKTASEQNRKRTRLYPALRIELVRISGTFSKETVIDCWDCNDVPTGLSVFEQVDIKYSYKIHGFNTTNDPVTSANTLKWYESEDAALEAATKMAKKPGNREALVIYKAIKIVSTADVPVVVQDLD